MEKDLPRVAVLDTTKTRETATWMDWWRLSAKGPTMAGCGGQQKELVWAVDWQLRLKKKGKRKVNS